MTKQKNELPQKITLDGEHGELRLMNKDDGGAILEFAESLPPHDLLFLRRDITKPKVAVAWMRSTEEGSIYSIVATKGEKIVGCGTLVQDPFSWSPHVREVRILVSPLVRQNGLGRLILQQCFVAALEENVKKLTAQMTVDQKGAIAIFEELGFRGEALLKDQVMDREGQTHDIVILSCEVEKASNQLSAYGLDDFG
jgi:L-amino acid N-acyltransferase YncA